MPKQRICHDCGEEIPTGFRMYQIELKNDFGDKTREELVCKACYERRKKTSAIQYKTVAFILTLLGVLTLLFAHEIANQLNGTEPLAIQVGGIFLIVVAIFAFFYGDPDFI